MSTTCAQKEALGGFERGGAILLLEFEVIAIMRKNLVVDGGCCAANRCWDERWPECLGGVHCLLKSCPGISGICSCVMTSHFHYQNTRQSQFRHCQYGRQKLALGFKFVSKLCCYLTNSDESQKKKRKKK